MKKTIGAFTVMPFGLILMLANVVIVYAVSSYIELVHIKDSIENDLTLSLFSCCVMDRDWHAACKDVVYCPVSGISYGYDASAKIKATKAAAEAAYAQFTALYQENVIGKVRGIEVLRFEITNVFCETGGMCKYDYLGTAQWYEIADSADSMLYALVAVEVELPMYGVKKFYVEETVKLEVRY